MVAKHTDESERDQRLGEIVAACLRAADQGQPPNREELLARHPEFAAELAEFFAAREELDGLAAPLREAVQSVSRQAAPTDRLLEHGWLGDFRLLREIGRGGMGVVYEAEQISLSRKVAVKVLPLAGALDQRHLQRFKNEALAAAQLDHPHIVDVLGVGDARGIHYYAMRLIDGHTLAEIIADLRRSAEPRPLGSGSQSPAQPLPDGRDSENAERTQDYTPRSAAEAEPRLAEPRPLGSGLEPTAPPLPDGRGSANTVPIAGLSTERSTKSREFFQNVAKIGSAVAEALDHAHEQGIIHRDIKPSNLMLDSRGKVWVTDFGLAHMASPGGNAGGTLTMTGDLVGTLRYMSPEQALAKRVVIDHRTDIYSLGVTLYELLTLQPAFTGEDRQELLRQIAFEEPKAPRRINKSIPAELETIVLKATEKNPADRYASAQQLAEDLRRFLEDKPIRAKRPSIVQRARKWGRRHKPAVATAAILLVLSPMGIAATAWRDEQQAKATLKVVQAEQEKTRAALEREQYAAYLVRISLAQREWENSDFDRAEELLDECHADLRRWEWHYLKRQCRAYLMKRKLTDQELYADKACFSSDGKRLAALLLPTGSTPVYPFKVWDVTTGGEVLSVPGVNGQNIHGLALSPDGKQVAASAWDENAQQGAVTIWDISTRQQIRTFKGLHGEIMFSPDGRRITAQRNSQERGVETVIYETATGRELLAITGAGNTPAWSHDGKRLAARYYDKVDPERPHWKVWDTTTGTGICTLKVATRGCFNGALSPDGEQFALNYFDGSITLWNAVTGAQGITIRGHEQGVRCVAFSPDGKLLASASQDQLLKLFDTSTGRAVRTFRGLRAPVALHFSSDGQRLASASVDGLVTVWDAAVDQEARTLPGKVKGLGANAIAFNPVGGLLAVTNYDKKAGTLIDVWDVVTGRKLFALPHPKGRHELVRSVEFSRDGRHLAGLDAGGTATIWDAGSRKEFLAIAARKGKGEDSLGEDVAFSPDGRSVATVGFIRMEGNLQRTQIKIFDVATGNELLSLPGHDYEGASFPGSVSFSPDGLRLASVEGGVSKNGNLSELRVWDVASGLELFSYKGAVNSVAWSPDGRFVAASCLDGHVRLWDATSGEQLRVLKGGGGCVAFSPDSRRVAAATRGVNKVKLWDTETGQEIITVGTPAENQFDDDIECLAFSPDGRYLAGGTYKSVKIWDATPLDE